MLKTLFHDFDFESFPVDACTVPCEREAGILSSLGYTCLCVCVDDRFPQEFQCVQLQPYTAKNLPECVEEGEPDTLYGWGTPSGNRVLDHHTRFIHDDFVKVVAWKRLPGYVSDVRTP